jgi:hypothetical protein
MAFIRLVAEPYAPRDPRLAAVLSTLAAEGAPIAFLQGVFMAKGPQADIHAVIDGWLHPPVATRQKVSGEVLSNGRQGEDLVLFTVLNRTDRRVSPGAPISEITVQLGADILSPDRLAALVEGICDAARAHWAQGFHGADQQAVGVEMLNAKALGRLAQLPTQDAAGRPLNSAPGWVGFFNDTTARALGFPAGAARFGETWRSAGGAGWMYRLTSEPLDLSDPAHLARLRGLLETA